MSPEEIVEIWTVASQRDGGGEAVWDGTILLVRAAKQSQPLCQHDLWLQADAADPTWIEFIHGHHESEARLRIPTTLGRDGLFLKHDDTATKVLKWLEFVHAYEASLV